MIMLLKLCIIAFIVIAILSFTNNQKSNTNVDNNVSIECYETFITDLEHLKEQEEINKNIDILINVYNTKIEKWQGKEEPIFEEEPEPFSKHEVPSK